MKTRFELRSDTPPENGRYVAFTTDRVYALYSTPTIAVFHEGRWDIGRKVYGWIGPLPTGEIDSIFPPVDRVFPDKPEPLEYDL